MELNIAEREVSADARHEQLLPSDLNKLTCSESTNDCFLDGYYNGRSSGQCQKLPLKKLP